VLLGFPACRTLAREEIRKGTGPLDIPVGYQNWFLLMSGASCPNAAQM